MKKWMWAVLMLAPAYVFSTDGPPNSHNLILQALAERVFCSDFSADKNLTENTMVLVLDEDEIIAGSKLPSPPDNPRGIIIISRGFIRLASPQEFEFFMAHEVGHLKMDVLGKQCGDCGGECEQLIADRFAIDFLESKNEDVCAGKTLLLKMILKGADAEDSRLKQLREHCHPIAAR